MTFPFFGGIVRHIMEWDEYVVEGSTLVENRENYQKKLGQLASEIATQYGVDKLENFSKDLLNNCGMTVATSTLKNYRWVWEKTKDLNLPDDLSYRTLQFIASSSDPAKWALRIKNEGLTSAEIYKLLRAEKGEAPKKSYVCKSCGATNEI